MDDKSIFENYLLVLKSTVEVFIHGTLESSNESVRQLLKASLNHIITNQSNTYDLMKNNNWYSVQNIAPNEINSTLNKLAQN